MELLKRIKLNILSIKESVKRFPITLLISTALAIYLIVLNEADLYGKEWEYLYRIAMVLGIGVTLSLCIELLIEKIDYKREIYSKFLYLGGLLLLFIYYFAFMKELNQLTVSRYVAVQIFLLLAFFYIPRLNNRNDYEYYVLDVFYGISITIIYSVVLFLGLSAIFLTIDQLFDANIPGKLYLYIFILNCLVFAVSLFLSKIPKLNYEYKDIEYSKSLSILLNFIVVPLISIYTLILYVYFAKILITGVWPKGLVSHLVLWYSTISVGVIFLLTPLRHNSKIAWNFNQIFPKAVLPILLMMFLSIYQRIVQYGVTENRYYIIVLGLWVSGIMIYFSFKKPLKNIIIPISLSLVILNSVFGPLSSFSISKYSQNKRFIKILNENNMIVNNNIVANPDISNEGRKEINNIINYFDNNHELRDLKILPKDFKLDDFENLLGFKYSTYIWDDYNGYRYVYYGLDGEKSIDISGFDYYITMNSWNDKKMDIGDIQLQYGRENNKLLLFKDNGERMDIDMGLLVEELIKSIELDEGEKKTILSPEEMTTGFSLMGLDVNQEFKFIFTNINGRYDDNDNLTIEGLDFIVLMGER